MYIINIIYVTDLLFMLFCVVTDTVTIVFVDREAIRELDGKLKEERKQAGEKVVDGRSGRRKRIRRWTGMGCSVIIPLGK